MFRIFLRSKIHRARVTDVKLEYVGSISVDPDIMEAVDILPNEQVKVFNVANGSRFETYAIPARRGSREVCINGAAARLAHKGDPIIIVAYAILSSEEISLSKPKIACMDENNNIVEIV